jgi:RNA polymerase sigma-70 factor (ECF subfamily)
VTDSETDLIRRAQAHDTEAFCELAERHARRSFGLAFHYCHNAHDAEDLSQEVWLRAYQALETFRSDASFYTWLRRIMINTFLNHQRSNSFRHEGQTTIVHFTQVDSENSEINSRFTPEETIYNKVLYETVISALAELTASQRLVFILRHYEGMSYEEIATSMNCSVGTAKKSLWRALGKLRVKLNPPTDEADEGVRRLATEF